MGVFESFLCGVWRESLKQHRHDWRASQVGIRALVFDTPLVRSACRLTLPTDESSVKTILLKKRWIVLISSSFIPYLYSSLLTFTSFDLLSYLLQVLLSRRWVSVVPLGCSFFSGDLIFVVILSVEPSFDLIIFALFSYPFSLMLFWKSE